MGIRWGNVRDDVHVEDVCTDVGGIMGVVSNVCGHACMLACLHACPNVNECACQCILFGVNANVPNKVFIPFHPAPYRLSRTGGCVP